MNRRLESGNHVLGHNVSHQISAPPPNEKKERKNEDAANAIERPNTIWMRRRNPPAGAPNASVRPVTMMMITAMILETGPSIDCRICWRGCSHGMFEPAANAGVIARFMQARAETVARMVRVRAMAEIMCGLPQRRGRPPERS